MTYEYARILRREGERACDKPGQFEGEKRYASYFYTIWNDGAATIDEENHAYIKLTASDKEVFPELSEEEYVKIEESHTGFVYCFPTTSPTE